MPLALWQAELRSLTMGDGTNYPFDAEVGGITGLGVPAPKTADVDLAHQDGAYGSEDFMGVRVVTIPFVLGGTPAQVFEWLDDLNTAWAPASSDLTLTLGLPFYGDVDLEGRPRGLDVDTKHAQFGIIRAMGTFVGLNPELS